MGQLDKYGHLLHVGGICVTRPKLIEVDELPPIILPEDSKCITLAEYAPECKTVVVSHSLRNYRRKAEAIVLVPDLKVEIDNLIFDREELVGCCATL